MKVVSLTQKQQERREAAYHEAGHGIVAVALGVKRADLSLWPFKPKNELDKHYEGVTRFHGWKEIRKMDKATIGYAGVLAELLLTNPNAELEDYLFEGADACAGLSHTDLRDVKALHTSWRARAINKSLAILKKHWDVVVEVANELEINKDSREVVVPYLLSAEHARRLRASKQA